MFNGLILSLIFISYAHNSESQICSPVSKLKKVLPVSPQEIEQAMKTAFKSVDRGKLDCINLCYYSPECAGTVVCIHSESTRCHLLRNYTQATSTTYDLANCLLYVKDNPIIDIPEVFGAKVSSILSQTPLTVNFTCKTDYSYEFGTTTGEYLGLKSWKLPTMFCAPTTCYINNEGTAMYDGNLSTLPNGRACQRWDSQKPHAHFTHKHPCEFFTDKTMDEVANFCRDNLDRGGKPWCYSSDEEKRWDFCNITKCLEDTACKVAPIVPGAKPSSFIWTPTLVTVQYECEPGLFLYSGPTTVTCTSADGWTTPSFICASTTCYYMNLFNDSIMIIYAGSVNTTQNGEPCVDWTEKFPPDTIFLPEYFISPSGIQNASNFCRDITSGNRNCRPWCYTGTLWDYCDIPTCSFG